MVCDTSCLWPATCEPPDEACNGFDDDCDSDIDEAGDAPSVDASCSNDDVCDGIEAMRKLVYAFYDEHFSHFCPSVLFLVTGCSGSDPHCL